MKRQTNLLDEREQVVREGIGDLTIEYIECFGARRGDLADLAAHSLVELLTACSLGHGLGRLGLFNTADLVAFGDECIGESRVGDLWEAGVCVVPFHECQSELFHCHYGVLMVQLVEFANLYILEFNINILFI